jgi:hypothetical protein
MLEMGTSGLMSGEGKQAGRSCTRNRALPRLYRHLRQDLVDAEGLLFRLRYSRFVDIEATSAALVLRDRARLASDTVPIASNVNPRTLVDAGMLESTEPFNSVLAGI